MIARKSALVFANTLVGGLLGLVAIRFTALYLGKELVNPVEFALGFFGLLIFLTDLGFGAAHTKRVSEGLDEGDCLATFAAFKLVATSIFALVGLVLVLFVTVIRPGTLQDATPGVLLLVLAYYVVKSLNAIPMATFDARRETARNQASVLAENLVRIALTVLLAALFAGGVLGLGAFAGAVDARTPYVGWLLRNPSAALAGTYLVGISMSFLVALFYVRRTVRLGRFRWDILKGYAAFALPIAAIGAVVVVATNVDRALLGFFGEESEAALFGYARRITIFVETIPVAVAALLFPTISAFHGRGDLDAIRRVRADASRYTSLLVVPAVVFLIVFARPTLHLFVSDAWLPAATGLAILAVFSLALSLSYPYMTFLSGTNRVGRTARIGVVIAVLNIVLNVLLIPKHLGALGLPGVRLAGLGVTGAALATTSSAVLGYFLYRREARRVMDHPPDTFVAKHLAASLVMAATMVGLHWLLLGSDPVTGPLSQRWYHLLVFGFAGGVAYLGALAALREFGRREILFFLEVVHPGDMLEYVLTELHLKRRR